MHDQGELANAQAVRQGITTFEDSASPPTVQEAANECNNIVGGASFVGQTAGGRDRAPGNYRAGLTGKLGPGAGHGGRR